MNASFAVGPGLEIAGEYTLLRLLGEGGMGAVYVARQKSTGKERALKIMHREIVADPSLTKRFEQEARVASRIQSEHVVDVLAAGVDDATGIPYLVMELLEGEDVRSRLARGPLSRAEAVIVLEQLCHAIGAAHAGGVVHRDLKPENVFLARERRAGSSGFVVKVLDFGIAKIASAATRSTRGALGSPMWMAPEQTSPGPITPAADVWALGLFAFEILTAKSFWRAPYDAGGTTAQLLREIVLDPIPLASARARERGAADLLPTGFDPWFARCLAREPAARFANGADAWAAFRAGVLGTSALATTQPASEASAASSLSATVPDGGSSAPRPVVVHTPHAARSGSLADDTGEATAFQVPAESLVSPPPSPTDDGRLVVTPAREASAVARPAASQAPAVVASERAHLRPETPIVSVREPTPAPPPRTGSSRTIATAVVLALAVGVGAGAFLATRGSRSRDPHEAEGTASASLAATIPRLEPSSSGDAGVVAPPATLATSVANAPPAGGAAAPPAATIGVATNGVAGPAGSTSGSAIARTPPSSATAGASSAASSLAAPATATATATASSAPRRTAGGFSSPVGEHNAGTWRVQERPVRVLTRIVSNDSNVADKVVRAAIDWNAWQYLRCYEHTFKGAKDLPEGVVTVGFDILDQLPRHAALVSSTITSDAFNKCVVGTLLGQTINAAGPDGKGHAVYAFQFVAN